MTLSTPTRPKPPRGFRPTRSTRREPAQPVPVQFVLMVGLTSPEGRTWWAVGIGGTLADAFAFAFAFAFARGSCPTDTTWQPIRWNDLYGD
jgi:hypothetical protein